MLYFTHIATGIDINSIYKSMPMVQVYAYQAMLGFDRSKDVKYSLRSRAIYEDIEKREILNCQS